MTVLLRTRGVLTPSGIGDECLLTAVWNPGTPGGVTADATDCLARFRAMWNLLAAKITTGSIIAYNPVCELFDHATGDLVGALTGTTPASSSGSGGTTPLPAQTQGLIRWNTGLIRRGRFLKGRTFVPLPDEADNTTSGQPGGSYTGQLTSAVTAFLTAGATASVPVIWGRPTTPGGSDGAFGTIQSGTPSITWSVQTGRR